MLSKLIFSLFVFSLFVGSVKAEEAAEVSTVSQYEEEPDWEAETEPDKYIGNRESLKFHRPNCPFALVMAKFRMRTFQFSQAAIDAGMRPCHYCLPSYWKHVEARIILKQ